MIQRPNCPDKPHIRCHTLVQFRVCKHSKLGAACVALSCPASRASAGPGILSSRRSRPVVVVVLGLRTATRERPYGRERCAAFSSSSSSPARVAFACTVHLQLAAHMPRSRPRTGALLPLLVATPRPCRAVRGDDVSLLSSLPLFALGSRRRARRSALTPRVPCRTWRTDPSRVQLGECAPLSFRFSFFWRKKHGMNQLTTLPGR